MSDDVLSITARRAVPGFTLDVEAALPLEGSVGLYGPNGAGKSSLLRLIAGFDRPDHGAIQCGLSVWCDTAKGVWVPPHQRPVGTMFQSAALFDHLNVEKNLRYADKRSTGEGIDEMVERFDLGALLPRKPRALSGGERQRVALARTLLTRPTLLLLDEPLAAVDRARKAELLPYLEDLPRRVGIPVIHVTHDINDVVRLSDRVVMMDQGRVTAMGETISTLNDRGLNDPSDEGGASLFLEGVVQPGAASHGLSAVRVGEEVMMVPLANRAAAGQRVRFRVSSRDVVLSLHRPEGLSVRNAIKGRVSEIAPLGASPFAEVWVETSAGTIPARITRAAIEELGLSDKMSVYALIKSTTVIV